MKNFFILVNMFVLLSCAGDGHLRGEVEPSKDGKTYFGVIDDNGSNCDIMLDSKPWTKRLGEVIAIEPGHHKIHCNITIEFIIPEGVVYKFDYWGP